MSDTLDDEWEEQQAAYEARIEALSAALRPCAKHNNLTTIEKGYEGELHIMANECGCWLSMEYFDSIDECAAEWNKQPHIDHLQARITELTAQLATAANYREDVISALYERIAARDESIAELEAQLAAAPSIPAAVREAIITLVDWGVMDSHDYYYTALQREIIRTWLDATP